MWKWEMRKCGNEEMMGLLCSRHVLSPGTVSDFYLSACRLSFGWQFHISPFDRAGSRAGLGTGRVKGPKARSLDCSFDGARVSRACLALFLGVPVWVDEASELAKDTKGRGSSMVAWLKLAICACNEQGVGWFTPYSQVHVCSALHHMQRHRFGTGGQVWTGWYSLNFVHFLISTFPHFPFPYFPFLLLDQPGLDLVSFPDHPKARWSGTVSQFPWHFQHLRHLLNQVIASSSHVPVLGPSLVPRRNALTLCNLQSFQLLVSSPFSSYLSPVLFG